MGFDFKDLKEKAKDLVDSVSDKAKDLAETGVSKAKEMSEIGKLKVQNVSEQEEVRKAWMAIGKLYCEKFGDAPGEEFAPYCAKVAEAQAKIAYNNERIADIKAAGDIDDDDVEEAAPAADDNAPEL